MKQEIDLSKLKWAIFSDDRKCRFALWRVWNRVYKPLLFIGLNPSTANERNDDPTISRLMTRSARMGFGSLLVGNLFAFVTADPSQLLEDRYIANTENDEALKFMIGKAEKVLCGWGSFPAVKERSDAVLRMIPEPYCLGINLDGQPRHPLYVSYDMPLVALRRKAQRGF